MNIEQAELDGWAQTCGRIHSRLHGVLRALRRRDVTEAAELAEEARGRVWRLMQALVRGGANRPEELPAPSSVVPLHLLDTPANRRLLAALREAHAAAIEVDRERGTFPDGFCEVLEDFASEVEQEVYGPKGHSEV